MPKSMDTNDNKPKKEDQNEDTAKYKYHQSQVKDGEEHGEKYPDKPSNHTTTDERLLNPDRGE
jgi:hypothetical protein